MFNLLAATEMAVHFRLLCKRRAWTRRTTFPEQKDPDEAGSNLSMDGVRSSEEPSKPKACQIKYCRIKTVSDYYWIKTNPDQQHVELKQTQIQDCSNWNNVNTFKWATSIWRILDFFSQDLCHFKFYFT